jgi:hypothetical protein
VQQTVWERETSVGLVIPQMGDKRKSQAWGGLVEEWGGEKEPWGGEVQPLRWGTDEAGEA